MLWYLCLLWSWKRVIQAKCALIVIKDRLQLQRTWVCLQFMTMSCMCAWLKLKSASGVLQQWKRGSAERDTSKGASVTKRHPYMQQQAEADFVFTGWNPSLLLVSTLRLGVIKWITSMSKHYRNDLRVLLTWTWVMTHGFEYYWGKRALISCRCQDVLMSRCLVKWNRHTFLSNLTQRLK